MKFTFARPLAAAAILASLVGGGSFAQAPAQRPAPPPAAPAAPASPAAPPAPAAPTTGQQATAPATPGQLAIARELIAVTGTLGTVDDMIPAFAQEVRKQVTTRPDLQKDLDEVLRNLTPELEASRKLISDQVAATYTKFMTEQEMRDTVAFFKTPAGAKYISVQPALIDDVVNQVSAWADQMSDYMLTRARAEMSKRGHQMQ